MRSAPLGPVGTLLVRGRVGLLFVSVALFLSGCTATSFLGQQYTNFTAYYNKFYNANAAFEKGLQSINRRGTSSSIDRTQYLPVFEEPSTRRDAQAFEKAIQKSADVLREHPDSKWVDDALLLIGKSYFYQQNYVGAIQKFREVIALEDERTQEARFWLARTLVANERYDEAKKELRLGVRQTELGPWTARLYLVRGQLLVRQEAWAEAARALSQGLQGDLPGEVGARGAFLLGQVQETVGNPEAARTAYQQVQSFDPSYALDFAARLNDIELQGTHANAKQALDRLHDLERDDKNYERRGEMAVVRARIYRAHGQYDRAQQTLTNMLYGEEPPSGASGGRLHYDLARLYRDAYKDFSKAAAHFDTASTSLGRSPQAQQEGEVQRMPAAPVDPGSQAERYRSLAERAQEVARMDSLLRVGRMSDAAFRTFVADLRRRRQAERKAQAEERRESQQSLRLRRGGQNGPLPERQSSAPATDTRTSDAGFLFHNDPARVQQGRRQFEQTWGNRPRVDNWRRRNAIRNAQSDSASETGDTDASGSAETEAEEIPGQRSSQEAVRLDLSAIPRDSASQAKMEAKRAVARYELANSLFLAASRPDSAATWYRRILQENGDQPVAKRALYALAEAYRAEGDTTAARQTYRRLVDQYPDTDLAVRARQRLGRPERQPTDDRSVQADSAYARAYEKWQKGRHGAALPQLLAVATQYPDTDAAPRSLLAAGVVYWQQVQRDSGRTARPVLRRHLRGLRQTDSIGTESQRLPSDSVTAAGTGSPPDSLAASADSAHSSGATVDSMQYVATPPQDTLQAVARDDVGQTRVSDSTRAPTDSAAAPATNGASDSTRADSVQTATERYEPLKSLLMYLTTRYSSAPQMKRARSILALIEERQAPSDTARTDTTARDSMVADATSADTTGQGPAAVDTAATDTTQVPEWKRQMREQQRKIRKRRKELQEQQRRDSLAARKKDTAAVSPETDTLAKTATEESRDPLPAPTGAAIQNRNDSSSTGGINRAKGGWTLLVRTFKRSQNATTRLAEVAEKLDDQWPVELLKDTEGERTQYRLVVGQFSSEQAAKQVREKVTNELQITPEVWRLSEVDGGAD